MCGGKPELIRDLDQVEPLGRRGRAALGPVAGVERGSAQVARTRLRTRLPHHQGGTEVIAVRGIKLIRKSAAIIETIGHSQFILYK